MHGLAGLAVSLLLVGLGFGLARWLEQRERLRAFLDGLVLVMVAGLCTLFILPHAFASIGGWSLGLAALGFLVPTISERFLHRHEGEGPPVFLGLALVALALHCGLDGALLAEGHHEHVDGEHGASRLAVTLAILVHRLPVGLFLGSTVRSLAGGRWALAFLIAVLGATGAGYFLHESLEVYAEGTGAGILNALLAGGLLHVVVGHGADAPGHKKSATRSSALGALAGGGLLIFVPLEVPTQLQVAGALVARLFLESAPAILLGFVGAGLLSLVPKARLAQLMTGKTSFGSALRGVVFGLPIPICSCGVVPLYRGLMQRGVPAAAAVAFLIATPELGLDSILLSFPLLGWKTTLVRIGAAILLALCAGLAVAFIVRDVEPQPSGEACGSLDEDPDLPGKTKVWRTFSESLDELGPWIVAGILIAGLAFPLIDEESLRTIPAAAQVPLFALISAPLYVCASSATPVASVLLFRGVAAGGVIAFLLTGPATNVTTYGALRSFHGRKATFLLLGIVFAATVGMGLMINNLALPKPNVLEDLTHAPHPLETAAAAVFALLLMVSLLRQGPRGFLGRLGLQHTHAEHEHRDLEQAHDHAGHDHAGHDHGGGDHGHDHAPPKAGSDTPPPAAKEGGCCG